MKKQNSPLVQAVMDLDDQFLNLTQLSQRIDELNLKSSGDFDMAEKLIARFNEVALGISDGVAVMSVAMGVARAQTEEAAQVVASKAELYQARKNEIQTKMDAFRALGEKVSRLTSSLSDLKASDDRAVISERFAAVETELLPLIGEAEAMKLMAQESKIKVLEQGADSMRQSLMAVRQKMMSV